MGSVELINRRTSRSPRLSCPRTEDSPKESTSSSLSEDLLLKKDKEYEAAIQAAIDRGLEELDEMEDKTETTSEKSTAGPSSTVLTKEKLEHPVSIEVPDK